MAHIITSDDVRKLQDGIRKGLQKIELSLDLGLTKTTVALTADGCIIDGKKIKIPAIKDDDKSCYIFKKNTIEQVTYLSDERGGVYKLVPTRYRPILQISGTSMHKQPFIERIEKDKLRGKVLDAGTGLGYTAIVAAQTADAVMTIEIDQMVRAVAKLNPYSQELFTNKKITAKMGDIVEQIVKLKDETFDYVILDGGTPRSSGEFFSLKNYQHAYRVLKKSGRLYHYVPKHHITHGRDFIGEIMQRLKRAGFRKVDRYDDDSYLLAYK